MKMKMRLIAGVAGMAIVIAGTALAGPAHAGQAPSASPGATAITGTGSDLSLSEKLDLEKLLAATDQPAGIFDAAKAVASGVGPGPVADFAASYEAAGKRVSGLSSEVKAQISEVGDRIIHTLRSCTGKSGYTGFWGWGWQVALNSCDTDLLIAAMLSGGGGAGAIAGILAATGVGLPVAAITAAVGGLIAAEAGIVQVCKAASYDDEAIYLNAFVTGGVGCWGQ